MSHDDTVARNLRHTLFTWPAQAGVDPIEIVSAEGAHFTDGSGRRVLDLASFVSGASAALRHPKIVQAIARQAAVLPTAGPAMATSIRGRFGEALATVTPPGLDKFLFASCGADANDHAIAIARMVTGRSKIIARYPSRHGDVRVLDPYCYRCPFGWTPDLCRRPCIDHVDDVIRAEGASSIAAVSIEAVAATHGAFWGPAEYLPRLREICDRHGILLILDEVLTGFGRTGRWFAFERFGVVPDMITMGEAITSGHAPLGAVAVSPRIADHVEAGALAAGLRPAAHPIAFAAGLATLQAMKDEQLVERAARLDVVLARRLALLASRHPVVGDVRSLGLYGVIELVKDRATREPLREPVEALARAALDRGVHLWARGSYVYVAPPLCIDEADLARGLDVVDELIATL